MNGGIIMITINTFIIPISIAILICATMHLSWLWGVVIWFIAFTAVHELTKIPRIRNVIFLLFGIIDGLFIATFILMLIDDVLYKNAEIAAFENKPLAIALYIIFIVISIATNKTSADENDFYSTSDYYSAKERRRYKKIQKEIKKEERNKRKVKSVPVAEKTKCTYAPAKDEGIHTQTNWDKL